MVVEAPVFVDVEDGELEKKVGLEEGPLRKSGCLWKGATYDIVYLVPLALV